MKISEQTLGLIHEFDAQICMSQPHEVDDSPQGQRQYFQITSVVIEGSRMSGKLLGSAGDWMVVGGDGYLRMDVRLQVQTTEGAILFVRYFGPAEANAHMKQAMKASVPTTFADQRIRTHWILETDDSSFDWINQSIFVGESRFQPDVHAESGFAHRVYRVDRLSG